MLSYILLQIVCRKLIENPSSVIGMKERGTYREDFIQFEFIHKSNKYLRDKYKSFNRTFNYKMFLHYFELLPFLMVMSIAQGCSHNIVIVLHDIVEFPPKNPIFYLNFTC